MSSLCVFAYLLHLHSSLPWNTVSKINQMKKRIYYCHHWRRLGASFLGGRGRRISAEIFFIRPQNAKFGGTAGIHCCF